MFASDPIQTRQATLATIEEIVREVIDDDTLVLTLDTRPSEVDGWDSLAHVSIVFSLEETFGSQMDDALLEGFETVGALVAIIDRWT